MVKFNRETLRDKISACWMGKNIGGTMGTPYEGKRELNDIQGFVTEPGEVLVNDDLDLQLVWLKAVEELGPNALNERVLGEYWLSYIMPHWNEYGVGKSNMREGFAPPMSGEVNNDEWRHSNGAWIRTEIWACLFPGDPERAIRYAYYDACVDHGMGEGTYAAIFVESMQAAAFVVDDIHTLLEIGLSKIPEDCRVARSVRLAIAEYKKGTPWQQLREMLVEDSADLGWFQAPANVAYSVLGLLYGEGDFKKSMILAINCGDDTDCTGATVGATLGIMYGMRCIPEDWKRYIGDKLSVGCLLFGHGGWPQSCTELTDRVMALHPITMYSPGGAKSVVSDGEDDFSELSPESMGGRAFAESLGSRSRYNVSAENLFCEVLLELDGAPKLAPGGELSGKITLKNKLLPEQKHHHLRWWCENGFSVSGDKNLHTHASFSPYTEPATGHFTIHAPEDVPAKTRLVLEVSAPGRFTPVYLQLVIMG